MRYVRRWIGWATARSQRARVSLPHLQDKATERAQACGTLRAAHRCQTVLLCALPSQLHASGAHERAHCCVSPRGSRRVTLKHGGEAQVLGLLHVLYCLLKRPRLALWSCFVLHVKQLLQSRALLQSMRVEQICRHSWPAPNSAERMHAHDFTQALRV